MNPRDNPPKSLQDTRPSSPHVPAESRPSMESTPKAWLHMASFGSQSSATPTPSASALRRAAAAFQTDCHTHTHGPSSGTGGKLSAILGTVGSSSRGAGVGVYSSPRSHTRSDSAQQTSSSSTSGGISSAASVTMPALNLAVSHSSQKNTPTRSQTPFDGYRVGGSSTAFSSSSTLITSINGASEKDNPWGVLFVHVLPLFNRDPLRIPIEDLNQLVKKHLNVVLSRNPSKAITQLESDVSELLMAGMVTLNSKLSFGSQNSNGSQNGLNGVDDDKLIQRVVELWGFFWDQVLPYAEGVSVSTSSPEGINSVFHVDFPPTSNGSVPRLAFPNTEGPSRTFTQLARTTLDTWNAQHRRSPTRSPCLPRFCCRAYLPSTPCETVSTVAHR